MYSPRHARPSCVPVRAAVGTTLTAVLLPITTAAPAIAQEVSDTATATTTPASPEATAAASPEAERRATTTMRISADAVDADGRSRIGVRLLADGQGVPGDQVVLEERTDGVWVEFARLTTDANGLAVARFPLSPGDVVRAASAGDSSRTAATSPEIAVPERAPSTMRISAGATGADGRARIGVRVLAADGSPIVGEPVAIEALTSSGWKYVGQGTTDGGGHALASIAFGGDTRVRAGWSGNATSIGAKSPEAVVRHNSLGERAVQIAAQQQGKPYRYGSAGPSSFDCSGFTTYIYKTRLGRSIPRTSAQQEASLPRVAQSAKRPGDLLFFRTGGRVSHVGVYAGGNKMWAAPTTGDRVKLQTIYTSRYTVGRVS